jgi:hypothetical protein
MNLLVHARWEAAAFGIGINALEYMVKKKTESVARDMTDAAKLTVGSLTVVVRRRWCRQARRC